MTPRYKKILLINPWDADIFPPPSLGYLQSSIKQIFGNSIEVNCADLKKALILIENEEFDLIGASFHSFSVKKLVR